MKSKKTTRTSKLQEGILTRKQQIVWDLRAEGYTFREIGRMTGRHPKCMERMYRRAKATVETLAGLNNYPRTYEIG